MKNIFRISKIIFLITSFLIFNACNKKDISIPSGITTTAVSGITQTYATSGGSVINDGGTTITSRGVCWNTTTNPALANNKTSETGGTGSFISNITQLTPNTKFYLRAYATNSVGTGYGNEITFNTRGLTGTVKDIDGNTYSTVVIGTQTWLSENLKTTKFRNGTAIPLVTFQGDWAFLASYGYCWYNNDEATYKSSYGALYTWYAASSGNICPTGWSLPSNSEWNTLITYLGGITDAGDKLREEGTTHWKSPNLGATNESGFTAIPGHSRASSGGFLDIDAAYFWSDQESSSSDGYYQFITSSYITLNRTDKKGNGFSVRCIKD